MSSFRIKLCSEKYFGGSQWQNFTDQTSNLHFYVSG